MFYKLYEVVGLTKINSEKGSWIVLSCVGDPFFDNHVGKNVCNLFVDPSLNILIGSIVKVVKAGKSYIFIGVDE